jgi:hypothetical protein
MKACTVRITNAANAVHRPRAFYLVEHARTSRRMMPTSWRRGPSGVSASEFRRPPTD